MTLALYGKPRRRQGGLLLLGLLAVLAAMLAGVATFTSAFAHHLNEDIKAPTCTDPTWRVKVMTGDWSDYREAVLTITDNTTPVAMRFSPYIADTNGDIVNASGSGTVHTAGTVKQYTGQFTDAENFVNGVNPTETSLTRTFALLPVAWDSDYQVGTVIRWGSELMKVTARSGDSLTLTVERGFGDSNPSSHSSSGTVTRWVRGTVEDTTTWDLDFDSTSCQTVPQTCTDLGLTMIDKLKPAASSGAYGVDDIGTPGQQVTATGGYTSATWTSTVPIGAVIVKGGAGPVAYKVLPVPPPYPAGTMSGSFDNSGLLNNGGQVPNISHVEFCSGTNPPVTPPTPSKVAADPSYTTGDDLAHWVVKVTNPNTAQSIDVKIADTNVVNDGSVTGGTCTDGDISDGEMTCSVNANATLVVPVKRAVAQQCQAGSTENSATISWKLPGAASYTVLPAVGPISITIPADTSLCGKPGITKTFTGEDSTVTNPADVKWTVTVTNPSTGSNGTTQAVRVQDSNVKVLSGPTYTGSASCTIPAGGFEAGLNSTGGISCTMPNSSSISFVVAPATTPERVCKDQPFNNTANLYLGESTTPLTSAQGTQITLKGDPARCDKPGITKTFTGEDSTVTNPADVKWTVTVTNPSTGSNGTTQAVRVQDSNVKVLSGPTYTGSASCTIPAGGFEAGLNSTGGISCTMPNSSSISFVVAPATTPERVCKDQPFNNTAYLYLGESTTPLTSAQGTQITLKGDQTKCVGTVIVKKVNLGPDTASIQDDEFTYTLKAGGTKVDDGDGTVAGNDADGVSSTQQAGFIYTAEESDPTAQGYKFLGMKYGYADGGVFCPAWGPDSDQVSEEPGYLSTGGTVVICLYNEPFGTLVINKVDGTNGTTGPAWAFTVTGLPASDIEGGSLDSTPIADEGAPSSQSLIPLGTTLDVTEDLARSTEQCATANTYYTQVIAPADKVIDTPGETVAWTFTNLPCATLGTGGIIIEKYNDLNGNGIIDAGEPVLPGWSFTTTGGGIPAGNQVRSTNASGQVTEYVSGFDAGTVLTTTEAVQAGWKLTGVYLDGVLQGTSLSNNITVIGGQTRVIKFLNYLDPGQIVVTKTIRNNAFPNGTNGGAGWTFVLNGCGVGPISATTNSSGVATFSNLPPAINCQYTITEPQVAPWVADDAVQEAAPGAGQSVTVNFVNSFFETCTNCRTVETPTPTATPEQPTATPTTPVDEETPTPTNTPEPEPTTPISDVEGERTPGPGSTPIAPSTGAGAGSAGGMNILLVLAGLVAISGGALVLTFSRKRDR